MNMGTAQSPAGRRLLSQHAGQLSAGGWFWFAGGVLLASAVAQLAKAGSTAAGKSPDMTSAAEFAAVAALGGVLFLVIPILRWRQRVEVFDDGFVWTRLLGTQAVQRNQVRAVRRIQHYARAGNYMEVEVSLNDGRRLSITGVENAEQLANMLAAFGQAPSPAAPTGWAPPRS
jgi:hypothetical protein